MASSGMDPSLFELHPVITMTSLLFLVAYYLAFGAKFMFPAYASLFGPAMLLSGSFCVGSLVSLLLLAIPWTSWSTLCIILLVSGGFVLLVCGSILLVLKCYGMHGSRSPRRPSTPEPLLPLFGPLALSHSQVFCNKCVFNFVQENSTSHTVSSHNVSSHSVFAFMIPILLNFLQIASSGMDSSLFELHPVITTTSLLFLVAYFLAFGAKFMFPAYASLFGPAMLLSGSFCVGSLVSLLLLAIPWTSWSTLCIILLVSGGFVLLVCGSVLLVLKCYGMHGSRLPRRPSTPEPLSPLFNLIEE